MTVSHDNKLPCYHSICHCQMGRYIGMNNTRLFSFAKGQHSVALLPCLELELHTKNLRSNIRGREGLQAMLHVNIQFSNNFITQSGDYKCVICTHPKSYRLLGLSVQLLALNPPPRRKGCQPIMQIVPLKFHRSTKMYYIHQTPLSSLEGGLSLRLLSYMTTD